ncbi:MAG: hypothetical protein MUF51_10000, partial [Vicinamibacteria bacterium]|nr:hypothetical protein [Vicinamibacteria bacterium]
IQPRMPWLLLANYNSNGYRGVIADEDRARFATSERNLIPDDIILPMFNEYGSRLTYSLEPQFPMDSIDPQQNIDWDWESGSWSVKVATPDGSTQTLGPAKFVAKSGNGPTTKNTALTAWTPNSYGLYTVTAEGWINDTRGRRHEGGGTYRFWIAKRMTLATATFQGMPYPVGSRYGRDIQFNPAYPADVKVNARLYVNSSATDVRQISYAGKASPAGLYGAAQGMQSFPLDAPGEYWAYVLATYTDAEGALWVCSMRHAGIVYATDSSVIARGKKIIVGNQALDRGETKYEGYVESNGTQHLVHLGFPFQSGDVLLIGTEGQGANKIEPVLTYQKQGDTAAWDSKLNGVGTSNLSIKTSNGYSPHLFPEYITDMEYYYAAAPRPGFMGRFIVGESITRAPYWPVSPNSFGSQIGASSNGDVAGDIYRLIGGVALRRKSQTPMYSGYIASAFLLPKGTKNNRIVAAGSEDLHGPLGNKARFFLVGLRPGTAFEVGNTFRPALQIDPILPVSIHFVLTYPDGRQQVADGVGDSFGSFAGPSAWPLDIPGVYRYQISASWNGYAGRMPGLPESGGEFFVYNARPAGATGLRIDGATTRVFSATTGLPLTGSSSASSVRYTLITPGAVIEQGELPVRNGKFSYTFDAVAVNAKVPLYDIVSITTGKPYIGRVIHLTFFSQEKTATGSYYDVLRVILRGTTALTPARFAGGTMAMMPGDEVPLPAAALRVAATDPAFMDAWDMQIDALIRARQLELVAQEDDTLIPGRRHERWRQVAQGVPVWGGEITRQVEGATARSIFGALYAGVAVDTRPQIGVIAAGRLIEQRTGGVVPADRPPMLTILPREEGGYALTWRAEARSATDIVLCFIDAGSGATLLSYSNLKSQQARAGDAAVSTMQLQTSHAAARTRVGAGVITTYDLRGDLSRAVGAVSRTQPLGLTDIASVAAGSSGDSVAIAAHSGLSDVYDFFLKRFGRSGLDGRDQPIAGLIHPVRQGEWETAGTGFKHFFTGSFWDGRMVVF